MANIWDTINVKKNTPKNMEGEYFTVHYSTEKVQVRCGPGVTLQKGLEDNHNRLGFELGRAVTWRDNNRGVVPGTTVGQPGVSYTASAQLETKG